MVEKEYIQRIEKDIKLLDVAYKDFFSSINLSYFEFKAGPDRAVRIPLEFLEDLLQYIKFLKNDHNTSPRPKT